MHKSWNCVCSTNKNFISKKFVCVFFLTSFLETAHNLSSHSSFVCVVPGRPPREQEKPPPLFFWRACLSPPRWVVLFVSWRRRLADAFVCLNVCCPGLLRDTLSRLNHRAHQSHGGPGKLLAVCDSWTPLSQLFETWIIDQSMFIIRIIIALFFVFYFWFGLLSCWEVTSIPIPSV